MWPWVNVWMIVCSNVARKCEMRAAFSSVVCCGVVGWSDGGSWLESENTLCKKIVKLQ